jgi:hypothetical protein
VGVFNSSSLHELNQASKATKSAATQIDPGTDGEIGASDLLPTSTFDSPTISLGGVGDDQYVAPTENPISSIAE